MIHLTDDEVASICRPLKQPAAQIRYLSRLGVRVQRRPDGTPLVLRSEFEKSRIVRDAGPRWSR